MNMTRACLGILCLILKTRGQREGRNRSQDSTHAAAIVQVATDMEKITPALLMDSTQITNTILTREVCSLYLKVDNCGYSSGDAFISWLKIVNLQKVKLVQNSHKVPLLILDGSKKKSVCVQDQGNSRNWDSFFGCSPPFPDFIDFVELINRT